MTTSRTLLPRVLGTIQSALTDLRSPPRAAEPGQSPPTSTSEIRQDFVTLVALLSKQSTNYTLALKSPPEETAAFATLDKIKDGVDKLAFLTKLVLDANGELAKRLRWALSESLESLSSFLSLSTAYLPPDPSATTPSDRKHLLSTCKTFWNIAEQVERDLPATELDAVRKTWADVTALLEDCEAEIKELSEPAHARTETDGEHDDDDDEDDDDGAEEYDDSNREWSETSKSIVATSNTLLRLSRLLVVRILALTDHKNHRPSSSSSSSSSSSLPPSPASTWTTFDSVEQCATLTTHIKRFSEKADDLAIALDDVQDVDEDPSVGEGVREVVGEIVETGEAIAREIERAVESATLASQDEKERIAKVGEWLKVWRLQRDQASDKLKSLLP